MAYLTDQTDFPARTFSPFSSRPKWFSCALLQAVLLLSLIGLYCGDAQAHVKWFAAYDLTRSPRPLISVVTSLSFLAFSAMLLPLMGITSYVDAVLTRPATRWATLLEQGHAWFESQFFGLMQISVLAFFTAIFCFGNVLLTPELKINASDRGLVEWLQFAIAVAVVSRHTAFLSAIGIAALYGISIYRYGIFHLLDYPIFLGVGAYIFIMSLFGKRYSEQASNILRLLTAITLMWGGVEKFAYPEWSFPLLSHQPNLSLGFSSEFYMLAAGFVEFTASFLLITGVLAGRVAAAILLIFFTTAIPVFGVVDAIGHGVIIAVLISFIFSNNSMSIPVLFPQATYAQRALRNMMLFCAALLLMLMLYYGVHWLSYGN